MRTNRLISGPETDAERGGKLLVPTNEVDDPEFWRFRAEEIRSIADDMKVDEAKAIMARIAVDYESIAELVEKWLRERK